MIQFNDLSGWLRYAIVLSLFWGTVQTMIAIYYMLLF
ncbi:hypothetical protein LCGC14_2115460, partial [marine sediment metagenome]